MGRQKVPSGEISSRLRDHLKHLEASEVSGEALKHYAERKGLSVYALYQAKKELRKRGAWPVAGRSTGSRKPSFSRVRVVAPSPSSRPGCRLRLPSSAVLEWETMPDAAVLADVIERVTASR